MRKIGNNGVVKTATSIRPEEATVGGSTRARVEQLLLEEGPTTAASLALRLALTTAGIRRHLDGMVKAGVLVATSPRPTPWAARGRGRPARMYALSQSGHERAPHGYDDLAAEALAFLATGDGVEDFARSRAAGLTARYAPTVAPALAAGRGTSALARALSEDGYAATTHEVRSGTQICQHHCPVAHVAERFPQLCEAETEAIGRLLGQHVQRLATIAHGDGICTTHVPRRAADRASNPRKGHS